jgi:hypothetical protein
MFIEGRGVSFDKPTHNTPHEKHMNAIMVVLAPSASLAQTVVADVSVEAEYGSVVVQGSRFTAAHHQPTGEFAGTHVGGTQPAPCNNAAIPVIPGAVVLVSHFDLDTLGGVLRVAGADVFGPENDGFWRLAEFVDVNGPHKLAMSGANPEDVAKLHAFWAWSKANRAPFSRDALVDLTVYVESATAALARILASDSEMLAAGAEMVAAEAALNANSLVDVRNGVIARKSETFVNHLYTTPDGEIAKAVVALNTKTGAVTVSFADPIPGVSARDIVQRLWGPEAGGHAGIAGSPRERKMTEADWADCFAEVVAAIPA